MKRSIVLMSIIALIATSMASAAVQKGDTEINLLGGWSKYVAGTDKDGLRGPDISIFDIAGGYGYFVTDNVQVGFTLGYHDYAYKQAGTKWSLNYWSIGGTGKYHFMVDSPLVPYIGGELLYNNGIDMGTRDTDNWTASSSRPSGWSWGIVGGARYEMTENNDFFVELLYRDFQGDWSSDMGMDSLEMLRFGIVHQFK